MLFELFVVPLLYDVLLQAYSSADFDWKPWVTGLGVLIVIVCIVFATINLVRDDKNKKIRDSIDTSLSTEEIKDSDTVDIKIEPSKEFIAAMETKPEPAKEAVAELDTMQEHAAEKGTREQPAIAETKRERPVIESPAEEKSPEVEIVDHSKFTVALDRTKEKPGRISTGIAGLDNLIGGGLLPNKIYLMSGETGTGKTFLGLQFLYRGLMDGQNAIYVSGDEKHSTFMKDQKFGAWDFSGYVAMQKLGLLDISPYFSKLFNGEVREIDVPALFDDLMVQVHSVKASRIVIDPLVPVLPELVDITGVLKYINNLVSFIKSSLSCTVMITSTMNSGLASVSTYGIKEFLADGVFKLNLAETGSWFAHTLSVRKMPTAFSDLSDHIVEILPNGAVVLTEQE